MKNRLLFVFMAMIVLALPFGVATGQDSETIVIRSLGNITSFNLWLTNDGASVQAGDLIFPTMFEQDSFTGEMIPGLTSWEISDDGLTYTFTIRDDAFWTDGTPITSADIQFPIMAAKEDDVVTVEEETVAAIAEFNVIDDKTYEIVLEELNCAILGNFQDLHFMPAHKYAEDYSDFDSSDFNLNPDISGGSYILIEWAPDEFQSFEANPDYWGGAPNIPYVILKVIGEQALVIQAIQAGEIDYTQFQGDLFAQIQNKDDLQFEAFPQVSTNFISLNWVDPNPPMNAYDEDGNPIDQPPHPLFSDINVRKAVAMGWNKLDVIETLGGPEGGTPLIGVVAPAFDWAYNHDIEPWPYDPDAASALLDEAGWTDSDGDGVRECNGCATAEEGTPLAFTFRYSDILQLFETEVLVAQDQLGQIGFDVSLELVEWANYIPEVYLGQQHDATAMSNSTAADPDEFTTLLLSRQDIVDGGNNLTSYNNPEVDDLIAQAKSVPGCDQDARAELYRQIQQIAHDEVAYDFTFVPNLFHVANKRIGGFEPGASWVFYGYSDHIHEWTLDG